MENSVAGNVTGSQKGGRNRKITLTPLQSSSIGRARLSDITNLAGIGRIANENQENTMPDPSASAKDYIAQLLKEISSLLTVLKERNKLIESYSVEMQKLRCTLQKSSQQNNLLARANTLILAEHNIDKDRLKVLQHEIRCKEAVVRAMTLELEEKNKLIKHLSETGGVEQILAEQTAVNNVAGDDAPVPASRKRTCNPSMKCSTRIQSLGCATKTDHAAAREKDGCKRKSLKRRSSTWRNQPTEDLFEVEDATFPICSVACDPSVADSIASTVIEEQEDRIESLQSQNPGVPLKLPVELLVSAPMHEDSSNPSASDAITNIVKVGQDLKISPQNLKQEERRSSAGRPMRRAAEKVGSYKEMTLKVKMRRPE